MIPDKGTGLQPDTDTAEQAHGRRHGTYQHGLVAVAEPGANRHYAAETEIEVAS